MRSQNSQCSHSPSLPPWGTLQRPLSKGEVDTTGTVEAKVVITQKKSTCGKFCQFLCCFPSGYGLKVLSPTYPVPVVTRSAISGATEKFNLSNRIRKRERKTQSVGISGLRVRLFFPIETTNHLPIPKTARIPNGCLC